MGWKKSISFDLCIRELQQSTPDMVNTHMAVQACAMATIVSIWMQPKHAHQELINGDRVDRKGGG